MSNPQDNERTTQYLYEQLIARIAGVEGHLYHMDDQLKSWRDISTRTLNLLSQRDEQDQVERRERQAALDNQLLWLRVGIILNLLLLMVVVSLFVGSFI